MKNTKIPQKHIDNLNLIKDIMTSSSMMEHFDYNTAKNVITIWKKIPNYLKTNTYICEFYNECYNMVSSYESHVERAKEYANKYVEFKTKYEIK